MKLVLMYFVLVFMFVSCKEDTAKMNDTSVSSKVSKTTEDVLPDELKEEDCDDKLEKAEEDPVEVSLGEGGDTGCSLDDL